MKRPFLKSSLNHPPVPVPDPLESCIELHCRQQIPLARQLVLRMAEQTGMRRVTAYYAATAVSEMASNLVFHAGGGIIRVSTLIEADRWGLDLEAEDTGPGIPDLELALRDGYSTRGSLGAGLGGIRRLMDGFEINTSPQGTRIRAWKWQT